MVLVGGIITAVAGGLLRLDKKWRQEIKDRMEMEARYHDTYKAVAKHLAHMGMTGPEHQQILDVMAEQFELSAEDVESLEGEAGWHPSGGGPGPGIFGSGPATPAVPPCPTCDGPMEWVHDYGEWYCESCDSYPFVETPEDAPPMPAMAGGEAEREPVPRKGKAGKARGRATRPDKGKGKAAGKRAGGKKDRSDKRGSKGAGKGGKKGRARSRG
jgi:hypothetical protein